MQLRRVAVTNVRSYASAQVDFSPGTTLIVGDVGAGKTSLLYAIEMALFGVAEVDATYLVRHGAPHAEVAVRFEDGAHRYEIVRRFRRVRRRGRELFETERITFREDGAPTAYSATEIRQRVIELLGFPDNPNPQAHSDLWRWAIYVPQEQMRAILSAAPHDRLETVRKALGVERYRTAAENAQELAADLRAGARHRREEAERLAHFDVEFAEASREADRLRSERVRLESAVRERGPELAQRRRDVEELRRETAQRDAEGREVDALRREQADDERTVEEARRSNEGRGAEIERHRADAATARMESRELPKLRVGATERAAEVERLRAERDEGDRVQRELASATSELAGFEREEASAVERVRRLTARVEESRKELVAARADGPSREPQPPTASALSEIDARISAARATERERSDRCARARATLSETEELLTAGVCPRCHQAVRPAEYGHHREEAAAAVRSAEADLATAVTLREGLESERKARERWERAHDRWTEADRRRRSLEEALERDEGEMRETERTRASVQARSAATRGRIETLRPEANTAQQTRERLTEAERQLTAVRLAVEAAARAEERARSSLATADSLAVEQERTARDIGTRAARLADRSRRIEELDRRISEGAALSHRLSDAEALLARADEVLAAEQASLVRTDTRLDGEIRRQSAAERGRAARATLIAEADGIDRKADWVATPFRLHVLSMERDLLAHAQVAFDRAFARYFAVLIDDPSVVARTDAGFTPEVTLEGEPTPAEALSGGERTALALAFRLALASVVRSLGHVRLETLLLDEPTDGFSGEQVVRMGELLEELALPQVILVSHEAQLTGIADRSLTVRKEGGLSRVETDAPRPEEPTAVRAEPRPRRPARRVKPLDGPP